MTDLKDSITESHLCKCGCGKETTINSTSKKPNRFIHGHNNRGKTSRRNKGSHPMTINVQGPLQLCECGCGEVVSNVYNRFIKQHHCIGKKYSEEAKQKLSKLRKGKYCGEASSRFGKPGTFLNKKHSEESKRKMSESGKRKIISDETKQKMSESGKDRIFTCEHKRKIGEGNKGENNGNWRGGISFEPYCPKFNNDLKERVREFFGRKCFNCGISEDDNGRKLSVHHVNYDKMVCCNDIKPLFVPLCIGCHLRSNGNREYWEEKFTKELMENYNGKCYVSLEINNTII